MTRLTAALGLAVLMAAVLPSPSLTAAPTLQARTIKSGLTYPWDVAFTPNGTMLVTERPGRVRVYENATRQARLLSTLRISNVRAEGEAGVMGIAATRTGSTTWVFVCASRTDEGRWRNQVLRYRFTGERLVFDRFVIRRGIRANQIHNGCAVEVGPDGRLWIGTGDAADLSLPQDRTSLNGKVLRTDLAGRPTPGNPFGTRVFTMGHRNVQGIAFQPSTGRAYAVEHGPDRNDEINRLRSGGNYGWPCYSGVSSPYANVSGCKSADSYRRPAWRSGYPTIATSGATFVSGPAWGSWRGDLFVSTLKQSDLRRFDPNDTATRLYQRATYYNGTWGRVRGAVFRARNANLYITTSNGGGRDRVVRIRPTP